MTNRLLAWKPVASAKTQLLMAAALWSVVGSTLIVGGLIWAITNPIAYVFLWLLVSAAAGIIKARLVLHRAARKISARIVRRGDGSCVGGFLSWQTWGLVLIMMAAGRVIRGGILPRGVVGVIYLGIGCALVFGSRAMWQAWWHHSSGPAGVS